MKQITFSMLFLLMLHQTYAQQKDSLSRRSSTDYALKSKNQKSGAWVLLGGGTALIAGGLLIGNRKESSFDDASLGAVIGGLGVISALGSIPLFLASGRNKRRAIGSAQIRVLPHPSIGNSLTYGSMYPEVYFKIKL